MAQQHNMDSTYRGNRIPIDNFQFEGHFSNFQRPHTGMARAIQKPQLHSLSPHTTSTIYGSSPTVSPKDVASFVNAQPTANIPLLPKPQSTTHQLQPAIVPPTPPAQYAFTGFSWAPTHDDNYIQSQQSSPATRLHYNPATSRQPEAITQDYQHTSPAHTQQHLVPTQPSRWQQAREYRRRIYEPPYIDPSTDDSIALVEASAETWIDQLVHAMTNTHNVKDTPTSHHRRLFLSEAIDPLLIEACCREIFTALIDRCKNGFRGPAHFNKALKVSHKLEPDRTATCEQRIQNVVKVLMWNKRACKDVLYEDWKIRLLVNHPLAYDKEKDSQKGSNDQRRKRQLEERERMERTEEELKAYREGGGVGQGDSRPEWAESRDDRQFGGIGGSVGEQAAFDRQDGNDSKRQRV